jgi:hypothetical protein
MPALKLPLASVTTGAMCEGQRPGIQPADVAVGAIADLQLSSVPVGDFPLKSVEIAWGRANGVEGIESDKLILDKISNYRN